MPTFASATRFPLGLLTLATVLVAVVPMLATPHWLVDLVDQLALQIGLGAAGVAVLTALCRQRRMAVICLATALLQLARTWPMPVSPPDGEVALRVLLANVYTANPHHDRLIELIHTEDPDVIATVEVNTRWIQHLDQALEDWPYRIQHPREDNFGVALYSRRPLDAEVLDLVQPGFPMIRAAVEVQGTPRELWLVHTLPPISAFARALRDEQLRFVASRSDRTDRLILGDFNATGWSHIVREVKGDEGLRDSRDGFGLQPTWPTSLPKFLQIPIDHALVGEKVRVLDREIGPSIGSDHLPVLLDLAWAP